MRLSKHSLQKGAHNTHWLAYHFVAVTKYRHKTMIDPINKFIQNSIENTCKELNCEIIKFHVDTDHIHLLFNLPPNLSISQFAKRIKGRSSHDVRIAFPELQKDKSFWSVGYFCTTVGEDGDERIKRYIAHHSVNDDD